MANPNGIEIIRSSRLPRRIRAVIFDWDGTLSLLREGWAAIMTEQMSQILESAAPGMTAEVRAAAVESIVIGLNGRPTIVQMEAFSDLVREQGGARLSRTELLNDYQARLFTLIRERYRAIQSDANTAANWRVPSAVSFLQFCRDKRLPVIVISGTEIEHVRREAKLLKIDWLVDAWRAPVGDDPDFSKRHAIDRLAEELRMHGTELLAFGDGVVETEEIKRVGGIAVAVATNEPPSRGINPAKRERLIQSGADAVIADYDRYSDWWPALVSEE
jgi:phosphoglycolate phosphatase-like HAD superfamily hydrolase